MEWGRGGRGEGAPLRAQHSRVARVVRQWTLDRRSAARPSRRMLIGSAPHFAVVALASERGRGGCVPTLPVSPAPSSSLLLHPRPAVRPLPAAREAALCRPRPARVEVRARGGGGASVRRPLRPARHGTTPDSQASLAVHPAARGEPRSTYVLLCSCTSLMRRLFAVVGHAPPPGGVFERTFAQRLERGAERERVAPIP
jgi:hypothetical protein